MFYSLFSYCSLDNYLLYSFYLYFHCSASQPAPKRKGAADQTSASQQKKPRAAPAPAPAPDAAAPAPAAPFPAPAPAADDAPAPAPAADAPAPAPVADDAPAAAPDAAVPAAAGDDYSAIQSVAKKMGPDNVAMVGQWVTTAAASRPADFGSVALGSLADETYIPGVPPEVQNAVDQLIINHGKDPVIKALAMSKAEYQQGMPVDGPTSPIVIRSATGTGTPLSAAKLKKEQVDLLEPQIIRGIVDSTGDPEPLPDPTFPPLKQMAFLNEVSCPIALYSFNLLVLNLSKF